MRWPTFTPKEQRMPDTPEPGLVDLDLLDPETTADLSHAAARPDPSHLAEFVDVHPPAEDFPIGSVIPRDEVDPEALAADERADAMPAPAAYAEHCPTCGQDVPSMRALIDDTLARVDHGAATLLSEVRRKAVADRPQLALLFRSDTDALVRDFVEFTAVLSAHFDPDNSEAMELLNDNLAGFVAEVGPVLLPDADWPGGRRPPSLLDYAVGNHHLIVTLRTYQGDSWTPLHTRAWQTALAYAAARMCAAQILGGAR